MFARFVYSLIINPLAMFYLKTHTTLTWSRVERNYKCMITYFWSEIKKSFHTICSATITNCSATKVAKFPGLIQGINF